MRLLFSVTKQADDNETCYFSAQNAWNQAAAGRLRANLLKELIALLRSSRRTGRDKRKVREGKKMEVRSNEKREMWMGIVNPIAKSSVRHDLFTTNSKTN